MEAKLESVRPGSSIIEIHFKYKGGKENSGNSIAAEEITRLLGLEDTDLMFYHSNGSSNASSHYIHTQMGIAYSKALMKKINSGGETVPIEFTYTITAKKKENKR